MRRVSWSPLFALPILMSVFGTACAVDTRDQVLVLGALHSLHTRESAFDYEHLRSAVVSFRPDVLVLEVRPDELAERKPTQGRPEYPAVIWPLIAELRVEAVAMEPGGELFETLASEASRAFETLRQSNPAGAAALSRLSEATDEVLLAYWQAPAQAQDERTSALVSGLQSAEFALAGPQFAAAQARWEGHMSTQVLRAVRDNPGKRVMVIGSYRNRAMLERAARQAGSQRVIDATAWFDRQTNAPERPSD